MALIGASTHHALQMRHYLRAKFGREKLEKTYAKVVSVAYVVTFVLGAMLYPSFRVHVRGYYLDRFRLLSLASSISRRPMLRSPW